MASYEQDAEKIRRRKAMAQALMQQSQQGSQGQMIGNRFVAPSMLSTVLSGIGQVGGGYFAGKADKDETAIKDQERKRLADAIRGMTGGSAPGVAPDPKREAALAVLEGLPLEQQQTVAGQQAAANLFPKPVKPTYQDVGDAVLILQDGKEVGRLPKGAAPQGKTDIQRNVEASGLGGTEAQEALRKYVEKQSTHAPAAATNVTLNTEKSLYGGLADERSKSISALHQAAQSAPQTIQRADRVKELLKTVPYTGAAAEWKLGIGKAAKAAGFDYAGDDISNTEMLARELGQNVLDSVKSSGLAGSQGLTEGERKFLLQIVGGTIELDDKTLARVADLNQRMAKNTLERWNAEAGRLDPEQLKTLGMSTIEMPAGTPAPSAAPKLRQNPDGTYDYTP